jgi:hypothetical protein
MNAKLSPLPLSFHVESDTITELAAFLETQARQRSARILLAERTGEQNHPVGEWQLEEMLDARSLATIIHGAAVRETQALRESAAYGVFAFHADSLAVVGRFVFRIEVGSGFAPSRNKADEHGIIGMLMGHAEISARLSLGHSREIVDQYQTLFVQQNVHATRQLEQAHARIRALEEREALAIETHERLQSQLLERQANIDAAKRNDDRRDEMRRFGMEKLDRLLPLVVAKLSGPVAAAAGGGGGAAAATNPTEDLIDTLMQTMSGEQAKAIANLLTQEQVVLFIHLYESALGRIAQKNQAAAEARAQAASAAAADVATSSAPDPNPQPPPKESTS